MLAREPLAIVGIGCRFPGSADDAESFWRLLVAGRSAIRDVPADRWTLSRFYHADPATVGAIVSRRGGFVDQLDRFDAGFWGLSPREAVRLDPQQRWLLEVAWEAIEDAGIAPRRLRGQRVGVFVGISGNDYGGLQLRHAEDVDAYTNIGSTPSIASNRISYLFDLKGPSASVDTACSSSLVAVWMACENIWSGNCASALAGGANALVAPETSVGFSKAAMLSPTGECFAFDARANGYVRAEGAGMIYVAPLAVARARGDRIYAVIRAVVVNQDGHTSSMTVPSVDEQAAMLREAYEHAGISPARVAYIEAHGTGTPVGDPIEAAAIGRVLGAGRRSSAPCLIGSVKTNIGHLEAGSGMAGLIKAALILERRVIPASLNYETPNPRIPLDEMKLAVAATTQPLPHDDGAPPVVGVNSFGFGGTNAHVVLEAAPAMTAAAPTVETADRPRVLPISARDETALREYVRRYRTRLADTAHDLSDVCAAAGERKDHHAHRVVIAGRTAKEMRQRAAAWLRDGTASGVISGRATSSAGVTFVFTGQGAQWWAMGRQLFAREPTVRRTMQEIDTLYRSHGAPSILADLQRDEAESRIDRTDVAQPAIFALQAGLVALWRSWGIEPAAVVGHSAGELGAAYAAGALGLEDAVHLVFQRGRLLHSAFGQGRMLAAGLAADDAAAMIADDANGIEIAAINSPRLVTLTGNRAALERVADRLQRDGVFMRWLRTDYAFHSSQMDPIRAELLAVLANLRPRASVVPFISTVTGGPVAGERLDAAYWWDNVRRPVQFGPAIATLIQRHHDTFLEVGPHPALATSIKECLAAEDRTGAVFHSLRREADDSEELCTNLGGLHLRDVPIDWRAVNQSRGSIVALPSYPWNRESFWIESPESARSRLAPAAHPMLAERVTAARPTWQFHLDLHRFAFLRDHRVSEAVVFPASGYAEIGLALARELFPREPHAVEALEIKSIFFSHEDAAPLVQVSFNPDDKTFAIYSADRGGGAWTLHAEGRLVRSSHRVPVPVELAALARRLGSPRNHDGYIARLLACGYEFGPSFREVQQLWCGTGEALAEIHVPPAVSSASDGYVFHPAPLDACFHAFLGLATGAAGEPTAGLYLPQSIRAIRLHRNRPPARLWAHARRVAHDDTSIEADIAVYDEGGEAVADILGFRLERTDVRRSGTDTGQECYRFVWEPRPLRGWRGREPGAFPPTADILSSVEADLPASTHRQALDRYHRDFVPRIESAVVGLTWAAFERLGWRPKSSDQIELAKFVDDLGISPSYERVTRRLLRDLETPGYLRSSGGDRWEVVTVPTFAQATLGRPIVDDITAVLDQLATDHPESSAEVALLRRTGPALASILSGEIDPLGLLFPGGSLADMERFYAEALSLPAYLELFAGIVQRAVGAWPPRLSLRILEVGAGTGVLTRHVLPHLPSGRVEYVFSDLGSAFVDAARKRFGDGDIADYRVFDIEAAPDAQQIPSGYFDLVFAGGVLHATSDLRQTLSNLRACLAPGGLLVFFELIKPRLVRDNVTFGLLSGYSRFRDTDLRPDTPLLDRPHWEALLAESGFRDVGSVTREPDPDTAELAIFIAAAPATATATVVPAIDEKPYLVFEDEHGVATELNARLQEHGRRAVLVPRQDVASADDYRHLLANCGDIAGVVHCWSLDGPTTASMDLPSLQQAQSRGLVSAFHLIRALAGTTTPVWFVTRNVHVIGAGDRAGGLAAAPLVGLARVANNEYGCHFSLIDLDDCSTTEAAASLLPHLIAPHDGELEHAWRDGVRYVPRLRRTTPAEWPQRSRPSDGRAAPYRLEISSPALALHETDRRTPGPGQIDVRVRAGGINFRDVMKVLGSHPGRPVDLTWLGDDFAGVVDTVGPGVTAFRPGDEVAGVAPYAFQSFATTDARLVFRKPGRFSFEQAATLPTAFLTAHYALIHLARLQAGERVLIHAGAGGVGQAAIQIAKRLRLEIFATAGSVEKRRHLEDMGVDHVMDSRTLAFADEVMAITGGRGVDAVLNSLAGDFIPRSLSVLAPFGRFLEIGKVDIYRNARLELRPLRNNISYFVIDLAQHLQEQRDAVVRIFSELHDRFEAGDYDALPLTSYPVTEAADGFRFVAQARHIGKVVLTFDRESVPIRFSSDERRRFRAEGTYLITGGAGGFGLELAKWIARCGAGHVVLLSRSGPRDESAHADIAELRAVGVNVVDARGDVANAADVEHVLDSIRSELPPLRGVFHAAMVLDDDLIGELDEERLWRVLDPKMSGAWNLHAATRDLAELEHFVCFSSVSTVMAGPRQSNYNAGNLFLEALASHRRASGLPALTVSWGALSGAGFVARNPETAASLTKLGLSTFSMDEALSLLGRMLVADVPHVVAARVDWRAVVALSPLVATSKTYGAVARDTGASDSSGPLEARLRAAPADAWPRLVEEFIARHVADVFGAPEEKLDRRAPLNSLGLDSLMTLELTNRVDRELGVRIPIASLSAGASIVDLAQVVLRLLAPGTGSAPTAAAISPVSAPGARSFDHLVVLRSGGSEPPIFAFHPVGGGVSVYGGLAAHLRPGIAIYGIESRVTGDLPEYGDLDEMVAAYGDAVRSTADGPYRVFGFSLGGYLAARVAERLEHDGETVELVGVVDWDAHHSTLPDAQRRSLTRLATAAYLFLQADVGILHVRPEAQLQPEMSALVDRVVVEQGGGEIFFSWAVEHGLIVSQDLESFARSYLARLETHCRLLTQPLKRPRFHAPLHLWRASRGFGSPLSTWDHDGDVAWDHVIDGDHNALIRPPALKAIAVMMNGVLDGRVHPVHP